MDLRKRNNRGGQWNPTCPIGEFTPLTDQPDNSEHQHQRTLAWINAVAQAERAPDDLNPEYWYTHKDPEWPAHLFVEEGLDPDPGPILRQWIEFTRGMNGGTRIKAAATMIGMDTIWLLAHQVTQWAWNDPDVELHEGFRRIHNVEDDDVITWAFGLGAFMTERADVAMDIDFADKFYWEEWLEQQKDVWGWRPEKIIGEQTRGLDCSVVTAYGKAGSPAMGNYPQGHSFYWEYALKRAAMVLVGPLVQVILSHTAKHAGFYRVAAGVHDPNSVWGGIALADLVYDHTHPIWAHLGYPAPSHW